MQTMRRTVLAGLAACAITAGLTTEGWAQGGAARQSWLRVETVQVKPERWADYREVYQADVIPALRQGGVPSQAAWRTAEFGGTYEVVLVTPFDDFAQFDPGDVFGRVLEPRDAERLREKLRRCIESRTVTALRQRFDLSAGEALRPFAVVSTLIVAPGKSSAFEAFLRETLPGVAKAGVVFGVYERLFGDQVAWVLVQNLDSLGELAQADALQRGLLSDGPARLADGAGGVVTGIERKVFRYDPELSFAFPANPPPTGR